MTIHFLLTTSQTQKNAKSEVGTKCYDAGNTAGSSDFSGDWIEISGSGGTCGDTSGSRYCGQALNFVTMIAANIPICDCTSPFAVSTITDNVRDAESDVQPNRGICLDWRQL